MPSEIIPCKEPHVLADRAAKLPPLFVLEEKTAERFFGFFTANIRNKNTPRPYYKDACGFFRMVRGLFLVSHLTRRFWCICCSNSARSSLDSQSEGCLTNG